MKSDKGRTMAKTYKDRPPVKPYKGRRRAAQLLDITGVILLAGIILCCIPLTLPRLAGYSVYQVISGSMEPAVPVGSLIYVKAQAPQDVEAGAVIAFYSPSGSDGVITHRVVQNQVVSGRFITKGDANDQEDPVPADYDRYIGTVAGHLPWLGTLLAYVVTVPGRLTAVALVVVSALFHAAAARLRAAGRGKG